MILTNSFFSNGGAMRIDKKIIGCFVALLFINSYTYNKVYALNDLRDNSEIICNGDVISISYQEDLHNKMIFTFIKIKVKNIIKGSKSDTVLIREFGGVGPKIGKVTAFDSPIYSVGEEVLVFLKKNTLYDFYFTYGGNQGKFKVLKINGIKHVLRKNAIKNNNKTSDDDYVLYSKIVEYLTK